YTDGQPVNVSVTVTYKDGSSKVVEVPVTVTQTDTQKYDPTVAPGSVSVNKDDVSTLKTDILSKVTVAPEAGPVTKDVQGDLPTTVGSHQVPVKVTYADGTEDTVNVPVDITETQAQKDAAIAGTKRTLLPRTGETTDVGMYAGLVALSAIGCLTGFKKRKKEEALSDE
ncbi:Rib/alpha-like domain-containing protein, partial [Streptococcus suis]